jgi:hypothetical protein
VIGGFFLQLSYRHDQSQVGRYLTGRSVAQSRLGLLFNGLVKVPMQLAILLLGVLVFVFYLFVAPPLWFAPAASARVSAGPDRVAYARLEARHDAAVAERRADASAWLAARRGHDHAAEAALSARLLRDQDAIGDLRTRAAALIKTRDRTASSSDTNYVFLRFVLAHLPVGVIGLVFACIFAASMNSTSAELNALTSTTVVDIVKRLGPAVAREDPRRDLLLSRITTVAWAAFRSRSPSGRAGSVP